MGVTVTHAHRPRRHDEAQGVIANLFEDVRLAFLTAVRNHDLEVLRAFVENLYLILVDDFGLQRHGLARGGCHNLYLFRFQIVRHGGCGVGIQCYGALKLFGLFLSHILVARA